MITNNKKAISPIVSTVLLIMIVIILAVIILLFSRNFIKESILKEVAGNTKRIEKFCSEVKIRTLINEDGSFGFKNIGNVPIHAIDLKVSLKGSGSSDTIKVTAIKGTLANPSKTVVFDGLGLLSYSDYEKVEIIPILLGTKKGGDPEQYTCEENAIPV